MPGFRTHRSLAIAIIAMVVVLCAIAASTLIDWTPSSKGLPVDISAIEKPVGAPLTGPASLPKKIKPEDLRIE